jgi:aspartyl-tRNA(Asn)/glutamyl-tRNA(Gln) amidotransferase subunit B
MNYEPVIGIEIHVQLRTRTKMFCGCALSFGEEPNTLVCPVCLGHPGTLPVTNAEAVHYALMIAMAFDCEIAPRSIFHRKNYFYPDLPKGYQISQYDQPLCRGGHLADVRIHRVHMEEDAAKLIHTGSSGRIHGASTSGVPPRLKSTTLASAPWIRPEVPACTSFAASSSMWTRWMRMAASRPLRASGKSYWEIW